MSQPNREPNRAERIEAELAAGARKQRNQRIAMVVGILVVLGAIIAGGSWMNAGSQQDDTPELAGMSLAATDSSILIGPSTAPVKVVIYEDFLCPYCRQLEQSTRDVLEEYAAKGKVQVEYRPVNILTGSTYSARAMNIWAAVLKHASPSAAIKLHDLLYENQPYETNADDTSDADILKLVKEAGGDNAAVLAAAKAQDKTFFSESAASANAIGLTGTPTVVIDGKKLDGLSIDQIVDEIEKRVAHGS